MPIPPKPAPYVRLSIHYQCSAHFCVNDCYYIPDPVVESSTDLQDIADAFKDAVNPGLLVAMASDVFIFGVAAESVTGLDTYTAYSDISSNGGVAGDSLPAQDVAEIQWHVHRLAGRRLQRGKSYFSGTPESSAVGGLLGVPASTQWATVAGDIDGFTGFGAFNLTHAIWCPRDGEFKPVTAWTVKPIVKTQRRRRPSS